MIENGRFKIVFFIVLFNYLLYKLTFTYTVEIYLIDSLAEGLNLM